MEIRTPVCARTAFARLLVVSLFWAGCPLVSAAPGDADTSFNATGSISTSVAAGFNSANRVVPGSGNNTLSVAGFAGNNFALSRYTSAGMLDTTFSGDGTQITDIGANEDWAFALARQTDGKLLAIGMSASEGDVDCALARYTQQGELDTVFGSAGTVVTGTANSDESCGAGLQQADGKLLVAGQSSNGIDAASMLVMRYTSAGILDTAFADMGIRSISYGNGFFDLATHAALQSDQAIVIAGSSYDGTEERIALARLTTDGSYDITFDNDGLALFSVPSTTHLWPTDLKILSDDRILIAATGENNGSKTCHLLRYTADGLPDAGFGVDGRVSFADYQCMTLTVASTGKLLLVADPQNTNTSLTVIGLTSAGAIDVDFGSQLDGTVSVTLPDNSNITDAVITADQKLVIAGNRNEMFFVARYLLRDNAASKNDFNADGSSDVLFLNSTSGGTHYWQGAVKASTTYPGTYDTSYSYKGAGDFDGNGTADIFFTRAANNGTIVWSGAVKASASFPGTHTAGFSVVAICDVNGDMQDDVIWHNATTGGTQIWPSATKAAATYPGTQNTAFTVAACADFDGDGSADIFWRNAATGGNEVWLGASKVSKLYPGANTDLTWSVVGAGDTNGNLNSDLIWYKASTGATQIWEGALKSAASYPGTNSTSFTPKAIGDYNGDGSADLLWSNNATLGTQIWSGVVKAAVTYPGAHSAGFVIQK